MKVLVRHPITESFRTKNGGWSPRSENAVTFETAQAAVKYCNETVHDTCHVVLEVNGVPGCRRSKVKLREETSSKVSDDFLSDSFALPPAPQAI